MHRGGGYSLLNVAKRLNNTLLPKTFLLFVLISIISSCETKKGDSPISPVPKTFTLTFDSQDGTEVPQQTIKSGEKAQKPTNPIRDGYIFENWYQEKELKNIFDFMKETITVNTTVYAKWIVNSFTLTFDTQGGVAVSPQTIKNGKKAQKPNNPIRTDYVFEDWYKEEALTNLFDFTKETITTNTIIYAKWKPTTTIVINYEGLHYVHFTMNYENLLGDKTVGFLITPIGSNISKAAAEKKKGYMTRKFTATKKSRDVFMFLHERTTYDLASGSTDIPFVAGSTMSDSSFETTDILQENTTYKIRVYDGDKILEQMFTTKSFADGDASSEGNVVYMGGLVAFAKADISLTIERKPEEMMLIPYADDAFEGNSNDYYENTVLQGSCSPNCGSGLSGAYVYGLRRETNKLASIVLILSPQKKIIPSNWTAREGANPDVAYDIQIISE